MSTPTIRRLKIIEYIKDEPKTVKSIKKLLKNEFHDHIENSEKIDNIELAIKGDLKNLLENGQIVKYKSNGNNKTADYSDNLLNDDELISLSDQSLPIMGSSILEKNGCKALIPLVSKVNESIIFHPIYEVKNEIAKILYIRFSYNNWVKASINHHLSPLSFIILRKPDPVEERLNLKDQVEIFGVNLCVIQVPNRSVSRRIKNRLGHLRIKILEENKAEIEDLGSTLKTHYQEITNSSLIDFEKYFQSFDQSKTTSLGKPINEPEVSGDDFKTIYKKSIVVKLPTLIHVPGIDPLTLILK